MKETKKFRPHTAVEAILVSFNSVRSPRSYSMPTLIIFA